MSPNEPATSPSARPLEPQGPNEHTSGEQSASRKENGDGDQAEVATEKGKAVSSKADSEDEREEGEEEEDDYEEEEGEEREDHSNPPLPPGPPPGESAEHDDGWQPVWDDAYGAYYFYNTITGETTWTNPRVPEASVEVAGSVMDHTSPSSASYNPLQYNPAIHGDYDPTAPYAQVQEPVDESAQYQTVAAFNRFTGKFQASTSRQVPENYNDENKSRRQMEFYFDVDAAANSHNGKSLKAERQTKRLTKKELKQFKEKRRARKEEKRKAWLKD
jgi:hypothetical protein